MHHASLFLSPLAGVLNRKPCVEENGALSIRNKCTKIYRHPRKWSSSTNLYRLVFAGNTNDVRSVIIDSVIMKPLVKWAQRQACSKCYLWANDNGSEDFLHQWRYALEAWLLCSQTFLHTTELNSAISLVPTQFKHPGPELSTSYSCVVSK